MSVEVVTGAILVSWVGLVAHNALSLPPSVLGSVETLGPGVASLVLGLAYARWPASAAVQSALMAWGLLHLAGGGVLSVVPTGLFPFVPEQSVYHYGVHALYALAQVPLVAVTARALVLTRRRSRG